jgi:hypothetical protein
MSSCSFSFLISIWGQKEVQIVLEERQGLIFNALKGLDFLL